MSTNEGVAVIGAPGMRTLVCPGPGDGAPVVVVPVLDPVPGDVAVDCPPDPPIVDETMPVQTAPTGQHPT